MENPWALSYNEESWFALTISSPILRPTLYEGVFVYWSKIIESFNTLTKYPLTSSGGGYVQEPTVTISGPVGGGITAIARAFINSSGGISTIRILNAGYGYTVAPTITIGSGSSVASGNFVFNELVTGSISNATGLVKNWDSQTKELKVTGFGTDFIIGDVLVGAASSATYVVSKYNTYSTTSAFDEDQEIQEESDDILVFTDVNPFGEV